MAKCSDLEDLTNKLRIERESLRNEIDKLKDHFREFKD